jgi:membrane associated rhomboid family serine protease
MGSVVITAVGWWVGPGVGIWLVLLAGAAGNALTAFAYGAHHVSVGASTATFGAVGILAALQFAARRRRPWTRRRAWVAIGAGLALLGMLGTGAGTDIPAHLFGLLAGCALGVGAALVLRRPSRRTVQWSLALAAAAFVAGSWWLALATATHG